MLRLGMTFKKRWQSRGIAGLERPISAHGCPLQSHEDGFWQGRWQTRQKRDRLQLANLILKNTGLALWTRYCHSYFQKVDNHVRW